MASTFIALVCVKDREIACLEYEQLLDLVARRKVSKGTSENQYVVLVTAPSWEAIAGLHQRTSPQECHLGKTNIYQAAGVP